MNIFTVSQNVTECAHALDDRRLIKMILETAQLLSTAIHYHAPMYADYVYKKTHVNHPCATWVRHSVLNYEWTLKLFYAYCMEYTYRFGKMHKSWELEDTFSVASSLMPTRQFVEQPKCFHPDVYRGFELTDGYKETMRIKWANDKWPKWTRRGRPVWG